MKKYASLLFALALALSLNLTADATTYAVLSPDDASHVYDEAALLSADERAALDEMATSVSEKYSCGVYVVTVDDMADYLDPDEPDEYGETGIAAFSELARRDLLFGDGYGDNSVALALSMAERDFDLIAHGDTGNAAFTDYGKHIMQDEFLDNFREDDWYGGFADFIAACDRYLEANANGTPIDVEPVEPLTIGEKLGFGLMVGLPAGLIFALIASSVQKSKLKSVRKATGAARYTASGGAEITQREDRFTHTTEVRTPIKKETDNHSSGSGFSGGTTINSGGSSHSSGKF